ncbi:PAS domain S-box protein [Bacillus sp. DNRA2]|uniref:PAS domain S-box protein n=1 Tax=Bacillus sp. DNRA2 TaxID=2723053 RepID=UPI00145C8903|nr:PAS domain S-box protein [Bacillus sp. DNRA2]NMD71769.1 PAS domain S-box protein [Bacillus sp. DNRA2]
MEHLAVDSLFMDAFNFSKIGMALVSLEGNWLKVNPALCDILGYVEADLIKMNFQDVTYPDDLEMDLTYLEKIINGEMDSFELSKRFLHKTGQMIWGLLSVSLVKNQEQHPSYFICQIQDITEKKVLIEKLEKSEIRYRNITRYSPEPMALYFEGKLTYVNEEGVKLIGATSYKELIGRNINEFIHHDFINIVSDRVQKMLSSYEQLEAIDIKLIDVSGKEIDVRISSMPIDYFERTEIQVIFTDITQRKRIEKELQESEQRYRALVESSANGIVLHQDGKIVYVNPKILSLLKAVSEDQLVGQPIINYVHPDYHDIVKHRIEELDRNIPVGAIEEKYLCFDGTVVDVEVVATPIEYMDKPAFQVIVHDISKKKEMQSKLDKSKEQYQTVIEKIKEVIFQTDINGRFTFLNPAWENITGYKVEESLGHHFYEYINGTDRNQFQDQFNAMIKGKNEYVGKEVHCLTKDGGNCCVDVFVKVSLNEHGDVTDTIGTLNDITKRKESEAELIASEERFRMLAEYSSDMISLHDVNGVYLYTSPACKEILQYEAEELIGRDAFLFIHPNDREMISMDNAYVRMQGYTTSTYRLRRKDGEYVWMESATKLISDPKSGEEKLIVVSRNVTNRKLTEQKLQKANEILQKLSTVDGLTGVSNRRAFDERLEIEWKRSLRNSTPLSLIMFDIDYFKAYNDTYGHQGGDGCLKQIASTIQETLGRISDFICRYGGEEFCAILPDTSKDGAKTVGEKIRTAIEGLKIPHAGSKNQPWVTISIGTATMIPTLYTSYEDLIANADKAVYQAKHSGRNCICHYE